MADDITIQDYNPAWPETYRLEAERITAVLGKLSLQIEHIGSTAVSGLAAKPVIDIMLGLETLRHGPRVVAALEDIGYAHWHEDPDRESRLFFVRWENADRVRRLSHIHAVILGNIFWEEHVAFRDQLRTHSHIAEGYARLKHTLAGLHRTDREAYTAAKTDFIRSTLSQAASSNDEKLRR